MQKVSTRQNQAERYPINHFPIPTDIPIPRLLCPPPPPVYSGPWGREPFDEVPVTPSHFPCSGFNYLRTLLVLKKVSGMYRRPLHRGYVIWIRVSSNFPHSLKTVHYMSVPAILYDPYVQIGLE